ncbi:MAG: response regulator transcription factor [Anaerolineae bacterium]
MASAGQRPASKKHRILILCPHTLIREGLRLLLAEDDDLYVVDLAADVSEALKALVRMEPDVIVVAYGWAGQDCAAVVQRLKADRPGQPLLLISPDVRPEQVQAALVAGATGYLPLSASQDELIRAVYTVGRDELTLHPAIVPGFLSHLASREAKDSQPNFDDLSPREQEVLAHLARGLSDRGIAQALFISVRTVQTHLAHIYAKLGVHSRTEAAVIAVREDWFPPPMAE